MTIAVTAPTGNVGSRVVRLLAQAGERPRVLVRDPAKLDPGLPVDVARGDLLDEEFVAGALRDVDTLLWVSPESFVAADPLADMIRMGEIAAAAIRSAGVRRVVQISSVGAERGQGAGLIDGLARNEEQLAGTGADLCTLRCGYYFTNLFGVLQGDALTTTMPADRRIPWVDPRDVGEVAAARLLSARWSGRQITAVHGPADLSWAEVATILTEVLGRKIELRVLDDDALRSGLLAAGLSERAADGVVGMTAGVRDHFRPDQARDALTTTPTKLATWAYGALRGSTED